MSFVSALLLLYVTSTYWRIIVSVLATIDIATCSTIVNNIVNFYAEWQMERKRILLKYVRQIMDRVQNTDSTGCY